MFHDKTGKQIEYVYDNGFIRRFTNGKYEGVVQNIRIRDSGVYDEYGDAKIYSMDLEQIVEKLRLM